MSKNDVEIAALSSKPGKPRPQKPGGSTKLKSHQLKTIGGLKPKETAGGVGRPADKPKPQRPGAPKRMQDAAVLELHGVIPVKE